MYIINYTVMIALRSGFFFQTSWRVLELLLSDIWSLLCTLSD